MTVTQSKKLLDDLLKSIANPDGSSRIDAYPGLRQVDAKVREGRMVIAGLPGPGAQLAEQMLADPDFEVNSRRVRLEALAGYTRSALRFVDAGLTRDEKKKLYKAPDMSKLTHVMPALGPVIADRWLEAQKCVHAGAHVAAVVMMGSVLEALLLARATLAPAAAYRASAAPKDKSGGNVPVHEWSLSSLIDVAAEVGWLKIDRKSFSHAFRDSRNVVHPWHQVQKKASFDRATCDLVLAGTARVHSGPLGVDLA